MASIWLVLDTPLAVPPVSRFLGLLCTDCEVIHQPDLCRLPAWVFLPVWDASWVNEHAEEIADHKKTSDDIKRDELTHAGVAQLWVLHPGKAVKLDIDTVQ